VTERLAKLRNREREHLEVGLAIAKAGERGMFSAHSVALAAIQRSLALIDGFGLMVEQRNVLCAAPLVRMQIDSVMRLFACQLVDEPNVVFNHLLEDKPLHRLKSRDGNDLRDAYLIKQLGKGYPWLESVYEGTSGFIHLSGHHFNAIWDSFHDETQTVSIAIGRSYGERWTEAEMLEAIDAFGNTTTILLEMCRALARISVSAL
jgi:hypothetical protein